MIPTEEQLQKMAEEHSGRTAIMARVARNGIFIDRTILAEWERSEAPFLAGARAVLEGLKTTETDEEAAEAFRDDKCRNFETLPSNMQWYRDGLVTGFLSGIQHERAKGAGEIERCREIAERDGKDYGELLKERDALKAELADLKWRISERSAGQI